jgi:hypothetical protein
MSKPLRILLSLATVALASAAVVAQSKPSQASLCTAPQNPDAEQGDWVNEDKSFPIRRVVLTQGCPGESYWGVISAYATTGQKYGQSQSVKRVGAFLRTTYNISSNSTVDFYMRQTSPRTTHFLDVFIRDYKKSNGDVNWYPLRFTRS